MSSSRFAWLALPVWTLVVWVPRIRNIWSDDDLSAGGQVVRTVWAVIFIVFAVGAIVARQRRWQQVFVVWTTGFWAVRGTQIALADHDTGFIVVHTVLALVSIGLALWSWPGRPLAPPVRGPSLADHG